MYNWEKQFNLISYGVAFVYSVASNNGTGPFDVLVRMRMVRAPHRALLCVCACWADNAHRVPCLPCAQDMRLAVPRLLALRAIPHGVVMAMGYWATLQPDRWTFVRAGSEECKRDKTCKERLQVFWHDWVYVGSQSSIAALGQVARHRSLLVNVTSRCLGLCPEEQTVLQLQARGLHLRPLGWRNVSIKRLAGPIPAGHRLGTGGARGPCTVRRAIMARTPRADAGEDIVYAARRPQALTL